MENDISENYQHLSNNSVSVVISLELLSTEEIDLMKTVLWIIQSSVSQLTWDRLYVNVEYLHPAVWRQCSDLVKTILTFPIGDWSRQVDGGLEVAVAARKWQCPKTSVYIQATKFPRLYWSSSIITQTMISPKPNQVFFVPDQIRKCLYVLLLLSLNLEDLLSDYTELSSEMCGSRHGPKRVSRTLMAYLHHHG